MKPSVFASLACFTVVCANSTRLDAQTLSPLSGLGSGSVATVAASRHAQPKLAVTITGLGLYTSGDQTAALASTPAAWAAQSCEPCAWARSTAFDDAGRLWVAASGYGLWRGDVGGPYSMPLVGDTSIAHWVGRASNGDMWVVTGTGVLQISAGDKVLTRGLNSAALALQALALPAAADGVVYAASSGAVYKLASENLWQPLKLPVDPISIAQVRDVLHVGTRDGVLRWTGSGWTELGPKGQRVNAIAAATDGSLVIATEKQGVQRLASGNWSPAIESAAFPDRRALSLATDTKGNVYAGTAAGLQLPLATAAERAPTGTSQTAVNAALNANLAAGGLRQIVTARNDSYALVEGQGVFSRVGKSRRWEAVNDGLDDEPVRLVASDEAAYVLTAAGTIFSFTAPNSAAGSWVKLTTIKAPVGEIGVGADGRLWVALENGGVLSRATSDSKWGDAGKGLIAAGRVTRFAVSPGGALFAGTARDGVYRWNASTSSWSRVGGDGIPLVMSRSGHRRSPVNALAFDGTNVYVGTEHGVFLVTENATTETAWTPLSRGLAEPFVTALTVDAKGNLIAGTLNGAFTIVPTARDATWAPYGATTGEVIASLGKSGNEVVLATRKQPGKPSRTAVAE